MIQVSHLALLITIFLLPISLLLLLQVIVTAEILCRYVEVMVLLKLEEPQGIKIRRIYLKHRFRNACKFSRK